MESVVTKCRSPTWQHDCCMIMTRSTGFFFAGWELETSFPEGGSLSLSLSLSHVICMFSMLDGMVEYG